MSADVPDGGSVFVSVIPGMPLEVVLFTARGEAQLLISTHEQMTSMTAAQKVVTDRWAETVALSHA